MATYTVGKSKYTLPDDLDDERLYQVLSELAKIEKDQGPEAAKDFLDAFVDKLGEWEGTGVHDDPGGVATQAFGVVNNLGVEKQEGEDDRDYAKRVASAYQDKLFEDVPEIEGMSDNVKTAAMSMMWNSGQIFPGQKKALQSNKPTLFAYELLDVVYQSKGPKIPEGEKWVYPGLVKRRAQEFNLIAEEQGLLKLTGYEMKRDDKGVEIRYKTEKGNEIVEYVSDDAQKAVIKGSSSGNI